MTLDEVVELLEVICRALENRAEECEETARFLGERAKIHRANGREDAWRVAHSMGGVHRERGRCFRESMEECVTAARVFHEREKLFGRPLNEE